MKRNGIILLLIVLFLIVLTVCFSFSGSSKTQKIETLDELNGKTVGIQLSTVFGEYLNSACPDAKIDYYGDGNSMFLAVIQGKLDAALSEKYSFRANQSAFPGIIELEEPIASCESCIAIGNTDKKLTLYNQINEFIAASREDGTIDELVSLWFTDYDSETCEVDKSGITGENGKLRIAIETSFEPFSFTSFGELKGYDIDFIYRFARAYGYEPEFMLLEFYTISAALSSGRADIGMDITPTDERAETMFFSDPYVSFDIIAVVYSEESLTEESNLIESFKNNFINTFISENRWTLFGKGLLITLLISVISAIIGSLAGFGAFILCYNGDYLANKTMSFLCKLFDGMPSVIFLMIVYYIVFNNIDISNIAVSIIAFSVMFCCTVYQIIRSGVGNIGIGQYEASRSQGFNSTETFYHVIFPQLCKSSLSDYSDAIGSLIKETSIVGFISVKDLTNMSDIIRGRTCNTFFSTIATAIIYYALVKLFSVLIKTIFSAISKKQSEDIVDDNSSFLENTDRGVQ